jgi:hypothetical protein
MERVTVYKATGVANVRMSIRFARQPNPALGDVSIAHCWFIFHVALGRTVRKISKEYGLINSL